MQNGVAIRVSVGWDSQTGGDVQLIDVFQGSAVIADGPDSGPTHIKRAVRVPDGS